MTEFDGDFVYLHNSGVDGRALFNTEADFDRFEAYLYLLNAVESQRAANYFVGGRQHDLFLSARGDRLVSIGAYSFTPHAFQILARPVDTRGVAKFMQKLQTAYTMYYNIKYGRRGRLFESSYRSRAATSESDLKHFFAYVHLFPASMFDANWDKKKGSEFEKLAVHALNYRYSSINEFYAGKFVLTNPSDFPNYILRARNLPAHMHLWQDGRRRNKD